MKKRMKKIVAVICSLVLLPIGAFADSQTLETKAATTLTNPRALEQWTIADVGMADGYYTYDNIDGVVKGVGGTATGESLDQKTFRANVILPTLLSAGYNAVLWIGEENNGIRFCVNPGRLDIQHYASNDVSDSIVTIRATDVPGGILFDKKLELMVSAEFVNTVGKTTDANVGIYIGGKHVGTLTLTDRPVTSFKQQVVINTQWADEKEIWVEAPTVDPEEGTISNVTSPDELETWSTDNPGGYTKAGAFRAKVTFPDASALSDSHADLTLGLLNNANYDGILLRAYPGYGNSTKGDNTQLTLYYKHGTSYLLADQVLNASDFGLTTLLGEELDLVVTTEYVNSNETTAMLNLGIYINGNLYKDSYITVSGVNANGLAKTSSYTAGITVKQWQKITSPDELASWSTDNPSGYTTAGAFRAKVTFPDASVLSGNSVSSLSKYEDFKLGLWNTASYDGILLRACPGYGNSTQGDNTQLSLWYSYGRSVYLIQDQVLNASDFGLTKLLGEALDLVVTTEYVNSNGTTATLNLGIYINGNLYKDSYITISGVNANGLARTSSSSTGVTAKKWNKITSPDELASWSTDNPGGYTTAGAFRAKVTFPDASILSGNSASSLSKYEDFKLGLWNTASYDGILLRACPGYGNSTQGDNTQLSLWYSHGQSVYLIQDQVLNASDFGLTKLLGEALDLVVTTEYVNNNLNLGIYINGNLYKDSYITISGVNANGLARTTSSSTGVTAKKWNKITSPDTLTSWDKNSTDSQSSAEGAAFRAKVTFPDASLFNKTTDHVDMWIGNTTQGILLRAYPGVGHSTKGDNTQLTVYYNNAGNYPLLEHVLNASDFEIEQLLGEELDLVVTTEYVNSNGTTATLNLGIYINGKLYQDRYIPISGVPAAGMMKETSATTTITGHTVYVGVPICAADQGVQYIDLGTSPNGYEIFTKGTITSNGVSKESGDKITGVGDYRLVESINGNYIGKTLVLYKSGVVNTDELVDIRDLVAMKRVIANDYVVTKAGKKGADMDNNGSIDRNDCSAMRTLLAGQN